MPSTPLEVFANNPSTTVSSGGTTAPAQGTVETWTVASSASFPVAETNATQFHVADPALPGEVITVQNTSGTTWTVLRGAESSATAAHAAGFTVVQVVTAGALQAMAGPPWMFWPEAYGANGDGKMGTGGAGASGQAVFTDAGASFVNATAPAGDVGKVIVINQGTAGSLSQLPFCGTIISVNSATSVTLNANLGATCTAAPYIYGTDDASAINSCITAATAYAKGAAGRYYAEVQFSAKFYMLAALTQTTATDHYNTHIPVPVGPQTGQKLVIRLMGSSGQPAIFWNSQLPDIHGTCLVSAVSATAQPNATYGQQSVIGGPTSLATGTFANTLLVVDGITIVTPWNSQQYGVYGNLLSAMQVPAAIFTAFAPYNNSAAAIGGPWLSSWTDGQPSNAVNAGFSFPVTGNNDDLQVGSITVYGASIGVIADEHFNAAKITVLASGIALQVTGTGTVHGITIAQLSAESVSYGVYCAATGAGIPLFISCLDMEFTPQWHVYDPNSYLNGTINWDSTYSGVTAPSVNGAHGIVIWNMNTAMVPGVWAGAPAAPATATGQQNTAYRDAVVYASATTGITAFAVGPASGSLTTVSPGSMSIGANTPVMIRVPSGKWYSVTYTGTLSTHWVLE